MNKTKQVDYRIAEIDAVRLNAGTGLTIGDIDDVLDIVRSDSLPVARIADVIEPEWRTTANRAAQTLAIDRAVRVFIAVRTFDANLGT